MGQFLGIYTAEEDGDALQRVMVEASDIAEAVAEVASRIPENHYLQTVVGDDRLCWQRGLGFVESSAEQSATLASGSQRVKVTVEWQNVELGLMTDLVDKLTDLIIKEMRKWEKNG